METNKIFCCDCIDGFKQIDNESVDLIFADPPFNLGKKYGKYDDKRNDYYDWCHEWIGYCHQVLKPTGSIYIMNIQNNIWIIQKLLEEYGFLFRNIIVWKNSSMPVKNRFCINYQPILFYTKSDKYTFNYNAESHISNTVLPWGRRNKGNLMIDQWNDIPFVSGGCMASKEAILKKDSKAKAHPCQMPEKLIERILKFSTNENDIVVDPFVGSGTTAVACKKLNRQFIGFEINPDYVKISNSRLKMVSNVNDWL